MQFLEKNVKKVKYPDKGIEEIYFFGDASENGQQ